MIKGKTDTLYFFGSLKKNRNSTLSTIDTIIMFVTHLKVSTGSSFGTDFLFYCSDFAIMRGYGEKALAAATRWKALLFFPLVWAS